MRRIAVRGIALHEGKLLCTKLRPYNDLVKHDADWWCLPGGTVEEGEDIQKALIREFQEETGIMPNIGRLLYVHQFMTDGAEHLEFFFEINNPTDFLSIDLSQTTHGDKEIELIEFVDIENTVILPNFLKEESLCNHFDEKTVKFFFYEK